MYFENLSGNRKLRKLGTFVFMICSKGPLSEAGFFLPSVKVVLFFLLQIQMPV